MYTSLKTKRNSLQHCFINIKTRAGERATELGNRGDSNYSVLIMLVILNERIYTADKVNFERVIVGANISGDADREQER